MRLIDADRPKRAIQQTIVAEKLEGRNTDGLQQVVYLLDSCPTVDAVPVVHGHWILEREPDGKPYAFHCSVCDDDFHRIGNIVASDYCPDCGAKMDGERREGE